MAKDIDLNVFKGANAKEAEEIYKELEDLAQKEEKIRRKPKKDKYFYARIEKENE